MTTTTVTQSAPVEDHLLVHDVNDEQAEGLSPVERFCKPSIALKTELNVGP